MRLFEFSKAQFVATCDRFRKTPGGEEKWQDMMAKAKEISEEEFLENVDVWPVLDEDETWEEFADNMREDLKFYESENFYFFQHAGFEYIWTKVEG